VKDVKPFAQVLAEARSVTELECECSGTSDPTHYWYVYRGDGQLHCAWCDGLKPKVPEA
jgi:hypothetical protein